MLLINFFWTEKLCVSPFFSWTDATYFTHVIRETSKMYLLYAGYLCSMSAINCELLRSEFCRFFLINTKVTGSERLDCQRGGGATPFGFRGCGETLLHHFGNVWRTIADLYCCT